MKTIKTRPFLLLLFIIALPLMVLADPPSLGNDDVDDTPIDGGLSLLIAAGVGYGIKKVKHTNKK